jgi:hypothetical protein
MLINIPWIWCDDNSNLPLWSSSTKPISFINHQKNISNEEFCKIPHQCFSKVSRLSGHRKQGRSKELLQLRRASGVMIPKYSVTTWMGSWERKRAIGKNKEVRIKYGA